MKTTKELSPDDQASLKLYGTWLAALINQAALIGIYVDTEAIHLYKDSPSNALTIETPIEFTAELFRLGTELSNQLCEIQGEHCQIPHYRNFNVQLDELSKLTALEYAAVVLGAGYHSWYESTKVLCWVVGDLCDGTPPWCINAEEEVLA